ncbi:MAG: iron-sulfur cluster assembly scaffold protein [Novosphingobium sp.]
MRIGLVAGSDGRIEQIGCRAQACAVGQAAAALFLDHARGRTAGEIASIRHALARWLAGEDARPDWPGIELLEPARAYPARHGAIVLAWDAALAALASSSLSHPPTLG